MNPSHPYFNLILWIFLEMTGLFILFLSEVLLVTTIRIIRSMLSECYEGLYQIFLHNLDFHKYHVLVLKLN